MYLIFTFTHSHISTFDKSLLWNTTNESHFESVETKK